MVVALTVVPGALLGYTAWQTCGAFGERCAEAWQMFPEYEPGTQQIGLVMRDLTGNGIIDTWVRRSDARIAQIEMDLDEDGVIDRRLVFDEDGVRWRLETEPTFVESLESQVSSVSRP
jgi:hypothetical protein